MRNFASSLSLKLLIGIVGIILISACGGNQMQEAPQAQVDAPTQALQFTPTLILPSAEDSSTPNASEGVGMDAESQTESPYPSPEEGGYPFPEDQSVEAPLLNEGYPSPDDSFVEPMPVLKTKLEATDPFMVNLASGEIQLVEFFAFW